MTISPKAFVERSTPPSDPSSNSTKPSNPSVVEWIGWRFERASIQTRDLSGMIL